MDKDIKKKKETCVLEGSVDGYMCLIDWKYEAGNNMLGNRIFYSIDSVKEFRSCVEDCGIVKVKLSFVEVIQEEKEDEI